MDEKEREAIKADAKVSASAGVDSVQDMESEEFEDLNIDG